jgi:DNA invertase Pin-like site-specific DNA recombinase
MISLWAKKENTCKRKAVAYYRHSAQDRQENSVEIQQDQVRKFAAENGIEIIREFADKGKSGLSVEGRDEFNEMIHDYVEQEKEQFQFVLVLDVSRWGRFQETDLSAYYTGLCLQHGKKVVFTTIGFPKQDDLLHGLHLSIERYRAASYSRELSGKVWKGCAKIASGGFWAGGSPPYGTRRLLLDEKRNPVRVLEDGEHKAIHNQRVTLTVGGDGEVETIRRIFMSFGKESKDPSEIAAFLNEEGISSPGGAKWTDTSILAILQNEIYAGNMVWNKTSQKMKAPSHPNPETDWIKAEDAFDPIVPKELFYLVQGIIKGRQMERMRRFSSEDMLVKLSALFERYGIVRRTLIEGSAEMVSSATYTNRFRSIDLAYQSMFKEVVAEKRKEIMNVLERGAITVTPVDDFVVIDDLFSLSIQPIVPLPQGYDTCWVFHPDQRTDVDVTIGVPLSCPKDFQILGYLVFPRLLFGNKVRIHSENDMKMNLYGFPLIPFINELRR